MILEASQYSPAFDNTMVPTGPDAATDPNAWHKVPREEFTEQDAQALIDHFTALAEADPTFDAEKALHTQLTPK